MIPHEYIEELTRRTDIVELVGGYVQLKRKGRLYGGLCPFHSEKTPSFYVYPDTQSFYCFGCGAGGDAVTFTKKINSIDYVEAVKLLAQRAGMPEPTEDDKTGRLRSRILTMNKDAARFFHACLNSTVEEARQARAYWRRRGLDDKTINRFGLGYAPDDGQALYQYLRDKGYNQQELDASGLFKRSQSGRIYCLFWRRVMTPIFDLRGNIIAFGGRVLDDSKPKYVNSPETLVYHKSDTVFALQIAKRSASHRYVLCEGYMDVISMHQAGYTNAVASLGTALTEQHAALLKRYTDQVILTYDSDGAGVKAALRAIPILKRAGISTKVLNMRPYKDPDEFMKNLGAEEFEKRIETARNSFLYEIDVLKAGFDMEDPEQKTAFYNQTARKLLEFGEALERDNYIQAVSREYFINYEDLRRLVNQLGSRYGVGEVGGSVGSTGAVAENRGAGNAEFPGNAGPAVRPVGRKKEKDEGIRRSERLLLTWLIEEPSLYARIKDIIGPEDFVKPLYKEAAKAVFEGLEAGNVNPAAILNRFIDDEGNYKEVAALFNASLEESLNNEEQKKAFAETVMKVRKNSLDTASRNAKDIAQLQEIIKQQAALKQLHISLD